MVLNGTEPRVSFTDLRDWMEGLDHLGDLRLVEGANWEEEIGAEPRFFSTR